MPEEIISLVLKHLVATAEERLMGKRITQVSGSPAWHGAAPMSPPSSARACLYLQPLALMTSLAVCSPWATALSAVRCFELSRF